METDVEFGQQDPPTGMLARITLVLDVFEHRTGKLNLDAVVRRTGLPRSTAHRILEQLVRMEWLQRDHPGYGVGRRAVDFKRADEDRYAELRKASERHLHGLHLRTGMVVLLSVLEGTEEVVLDRVGGGLVGRGESTAGHRSSAHLSPGGRAMLSALPSAAVQDLASGWTTDEDYASPASGDLRRELTKIRRRGGLSMDCPSAGSERGGSVSAVICGRSELIAAIRLCAERPGPVIDDAASLVLDTARRVSRELHLRSS